MFSISKNSESIKTRIETEHKNNEYSVFVRVRIVNPLKQGLKRNYK